MGRGRTRVRSTIVIAGLAAALLPFVLSRIRAEDRDSKADSKPAAEAPQFAAGQIEFFEKQVHPILKACCLKCHGGEEKIRGGLRLTSRANVLKGGDQGPAVDLEHPAESLLLAAINYSGLEMPPSGKLQKSEIDVL